MLVPARLAYGLAREGLMPAVFARVHPTRSVPHVGVLVSFGLVALLILTGQTSLALGICVLALVLLYGLHSFALLCLPHTNPELYAQVTSGLSRRLQVVAGVGSTLAMGALVAAQVHADLQVPFLAGASGMLLIWGAAGGLVYRVLRGR